MNNETTTTSGENNTIAIMRNTNDIDDDVPLPGFRFYPTDEELVGFYLRHKADNKPLSIELIRQVDIYKFEPWDLPRSGGGEDKEGFFFCKRERKYKNSIRPNRVTGCGFWKATGIDKPIYSNNYVGRDHNEGGYGNANTSVIGLKKTLVYYRGSAGKGTKTEWMMQEFRLPAPHEADTYKIRTTATAATSLSAVKNSTQEAEVWTLCRVFKRNVTFKKYTTDWKEVSTKPIQQQTNENTITSMTCSITDFNSNYMNNGAQVSLIGSRTDHEVALNNDINYIIRDQHNEKKPFVYYNIVNNADRRNPSISSSTASNCSLNDIINPNKCGNLFGSNYVNGQFPMCDDNWDELRSVVDQFGFNP